MSVYELILKRRSIRSFQQTPIAEDILLQLITAASVAPSAANLQPLEYIMVTEPMTVAAVFTTLGWAAYIVPRGNPPVGKRPVAYVVVLANANIKESGWDKDVGAAIENIILVALAEGIGSCWLESIARERLQVILNIPGTQKISSVVALGYPAEEPTMEKLACSTDSIKYWKDNQGQLHVPKRCLNDILHYNKYGIKKNSNL